jgi:hypothetical protein
MSQAGARVQRYRYTFKYIDQKTNKGPPNFSTKEWILGMDSRFGRFVGTAPHGNPPVMQVPRERTLFAVLTRHVCRVSINSRFSNSFYFL